MTGITGYLLSLAAAAIVCAVIRRMLSGKGSAAKLGNLMSGVFLTVTILSPLTTIRLDALQDWTWEHETSGKQAVAQGESLARKELETIISQRVRAYILEKASQFESELKVMVHLSQDPIPVPIAVSITGEISPYGKRQLQSWIANDLGIPKEAQTWT